MPCRIEEKEDEEVTLTIVRVVPPMKERKEKP